MKKKKWKPRKPTGREAWFLSMIGSKVWKSGYESTDCAEYNEGIFILDKYVATYLYSEELRSSFGGPDVNFFPSKKERDDYDNQ